MDMLLFYDFSAAIGGDGHRDGIVVFCGERAGATAMCCNNSMAAVIRHHKLVLHPRRHHVSPTAAPPLRPHLMRETDSVADVRVWKG